MAENQPLGRFCWHDLMTSDPQAAQSFYTKIAGWGTQDWEGGEKPYTMWTTGGVPIGGVTQLPEELAARKVPPHWMAHISTPNADETAAKAVELGGKVQNEATDIPTVGRFAVLADPQGAVFAVFTSAGDTPGHDGPPNLGEFSWNELATTDHEAAWAFYSALFGWDKMDAMDMGPMGIYQVYGRKEIPLGGMFNKPAAMPGPPTWIYYVLVKDVHQAAEAVNSSGGRVINGPMEVPGGDYIAQCLDPQGAVFAIHHRSESSS